MKETYVRRAPALGAYLGEYIGGYLSEVHDARVSVTAYCVLQPSGFGIYAMPDTLYVCVRACVLVCIVCMRASVYRPMGLRCSEANAHRAALQHARGPWSSQVYRKAWSCPRAPSSAALCAFMDAPMCACWLCYARMLLCVLPPPPPTPAHPRGSFVPIPPPPTTPWQGSGFRV